MRFVAGTPDIPDELIKDVSDGHAVFLCGAGVSKRVGMPLFSRLADQIYAAIGETPDNEAAEIEALNRGEYDRALRSLERRTRLPRMPSRVRTATTRLLTPAAGLAVPDHLNLLRLSQDSEGQVRILTTNFDPLFECAAIAEGWTVPSHAGKALPRPGTPEDHGILHLHGRIAFAPCNILASELILTSADFGDAYLRDGWAAQYIEDRMRVNTLVLVGYAAEDTAMRLLLETLDADRERFRDLKKIYAIERRTPISASIWNAKGIVPIEFADYDQIYVTLGEWATYATNPAAYGHRRLRDIVGAAAPARAQE
jgi:SIR2-like domain